MLFPCPGKTRDACRETVFSSSKTIEEVINSVPSGATGSATNNFNLRLPCVQTVMAARDELHTALQSLSNAFNPQGNEEEKTGSFGSEKSLVEMKEGPLVASAMGMNRGDPKIVYSLSSGVSSSNDDDVCWV